MRLLRLLQSNPRTAIDTLETATRWTSARLVQSMRSRLSHELDLRLRLNDKDAAPLAAVYAVDHKVTR